MKITIVGNGAWGKAVGSVLLQNKHEFSFCERGEKLTNSDITILAVPTQAVREVLENSEINFVSIIINCAKGIERETHLLPYEIVKELFGEQVDYFSLMGPSFAEELSLSMPTLVNLAYVHNRNVEAMVKLFQTDYLRVKQTPCVEALEIGAAFKNVYAIAAGISSGLGYGINTQTKLILTAFEEISLLCNKLGYPIDTSVRPGIIGDLILTCNSTESRNFRFGKILAKYPSSEAMQKINALVEGYYTASSVSHYCQKANVQLPLAQFVVDVLHEGDIKDVKNGFLAFAKNV